VSVAAELQRARGALRLVVKQRGGVSVLADLREEGCLKARFPHGDGWFEAVTLNSSGGIAGGDQLNLDLHVQEGARASFASQAAERFYRARAADAPARVAARLTLDAGAAAEWLPQESILFDHAALDRRLDVAMAADAAFLGIESLVFGRAAMGERVAALRLADTISVRRAGRLILREAVRLAGGVAALLQRRATGAGARALAHHVQLAPDAEARLDALRAAWADVPAETGASAWDGMLLGRIVAPDAAALRRTVLAGLRVLRGERPLPRVWLC
jgi:urease accessory protein